MRFDMYRISKTIFLIFILCLPITAQSLSFVETLFSNQGYPELEQAHGYIKVSPDGRHVYLSGGSFSHTEFGQYFPATGGILTFSRDINTGKLNFIDAIIQGVDADNLIAGELAISPDGKQVYLPAGLDSFFGGRRDLIVYKRDEQTGVLTQIEEKIGLGGISAAVSPDGKNVYVLGGQVNLPDLNIFVRNEIDGTVTFIDKVSALDSSLDRPQRVIVSQDGRNVYILVFEGRVIVLSRDQVTGTLTRSQVITVPSGLETLVAARDGRHLYAGFNQLCTGCGSAIYVLSRDELTGKLALLGEVPPQSGALDMVVSPDGSEVYADYSYNVEVLTRDSNTGALTPSEIFSEGLGGVVGIYGRYSLGVSPDGKNVYVTGNYQDVASIAIFKRSDPPLPPGTVQFTDVSYRMSKSVELAKLTVSRTGNIAEAATVAYMTAPAMEDADYQPVSGLLSWNAGDGTSKIIEIPLNNDGKNDPGKILRIRLMNATGGVVMGSPSIAKLTIIDNLIPLILLLLDDQ